MASPVCPATRLTSSDSRDSTNRSSTPATSGLKTITPLGSRAFWRWNPHCWCSLRHFRLHFLYFCCHHLQISTELCAGSVSIFNIFKCMSHTKICRGEQNELRTENSMCRCPDHAKDFLFIGFGRVKLSALTWNPRSLLDLEQHAEIYMLAESSSRRRQ